MFYIVFILILAEHTCEHGMDSNQCYKPDFNKYCVKETLFYFQIHYHAHECVLRPVKALKV